MIHLSKAKTKRIIRKTTALAGALALAAVFAFPIGTEITGVSFGNAIVANAEEVASGTCGEKLTWSINSDKKLTVSGSGTMSDWSYPEAAPWFKYKPTYIEVCAGVASIGDYAFGNNPELKSVTIHEGVEAIGQDAFWNCTSLSNVTIPNSVSVIELRAFRNCSSLESVTLPTNSSFTSIENDTFINCTKLSSISIPASVESIGTEAFRYCSSLESVDFPSDCKLTSIENKAFTDCTSLKSVVLPTSLTSLGYFVFVNCTSLEKVTFLSSVTSDMISILDGCQNLVCVIYPTDMDLNKANITDTASRVEYTIGDKGYITITKIQLGTDKTSVDIPKAIGSHTVAAVAEEYRQFVGEHSHYIDISNISCTKDHVKFDLTCIICGSKKGERSFTFSKVSETHVDLMKQQDMQLVIDFVNNSTEESDTDILTPGQLTAIDYVLANDYGVKA